MQSTNWTKTWTTRLILTLGCAALMASCSTKKQIVNNQIGTDPYISKTEFGNLAKSKTEEGAFEGREYYLVRGVEDASTRNVIDAIPGFQMEFGVVKIRVTESEFQIMPVKGNSALAWTPNFAGEPDPNKPIASFPIESHFDVKRDVNDYGETTNRVVEDKKRPWYEREYMRVKWDQPKSNSFSHTAQIAFFGKASESQQNILVYPHRESDGAITFTVETLLKDEKQSLWDVYISSIFQDATNSGTRVLFKTYLIPRDIRAADYVKQEYSDQDMKRFGLFRSENAQITPGRGAEDNKIEQLANLFNVCGPEVKFPGTDRLRSCATGKIVWHLASDFDETYLKETQWSISQWNKTFKQALNRQDDVVVLSSDRVSKTDPRFNVLTAYAPQTASAGLAGVAQMLTDPDTGQIISARANVFTFFLNSMRESTRDMIDALIDDQTQIAELSKPRDPNGGVALVGSQDGGGAHLNTATNSLQRMIGRAAIRDEVEGLRMALGLNQNARGLDSAKTNSLEQALAAQINQMQRGAEGVSTQTLNKSRELASQFSNMNKLKQVAVDSYVRSMGTVGDALNNRELVLSKAYNLVSPKASVVDAAFANTLGKHGQPLQVMAEEKLLETSNLANQMAYAGTTVSNLNGLQNPSEAFIKNMFRTGLSRLSNFKGGLGANRPVDDFLLRQFEAAYNVKTAEFVEDAVSNYLLNRVKELQAVNDAAGLVQALKDQKEALAFEISSLSFTKVLLHEMGHTFGLRHNFMGSFDRQNYDPQWHKIYQCLASGSLRPSCQVPLAATMQDTTGASVATTRTYNIHDLDFWASSTVMDYHGAFVEKGGLGPYDLAAITYGYHVDSPRADLAVANQGFKFCTDQAVGEDLFCQRFDRGHNMATRVAYDIESFQRSYVRTHFRRNRASFTYFGAEQAIGRSVRSMLNIRQVMDEFIYQFVYSGTASGGCPQFIAKSVEAGEMANICSNEGAQEAVNSGVDFNDWSTFIYSLIDPQGRLRVSEFEFQPQGFADLMFANYLASDFFVGVLGAPEPGDYLALKGADDIYKMATLTAADSMEKPSSESEKIASLEAYAANRPEIKDKTKFVKENLKNVVSLVPGQVAKVFNSYAMDVREGKEPYNIGYFWDKYYALLVLGTRDVGINRYRLASMAGNAYIWPQTRSIVTSLYDKLIVDDKLVSTLPITIEGKAVHAPIEGKSDINLRFYAIVFGLMDFVTEQEKSYLSKMDICVDSALPGAVKKCGNSLGYKTAKIKDLNGGFEYVATESLTEDSIAYKLLSKAQEFSDRRDLEANAFETKAETLKALNTELNTLEATRANLEKRLSASPNEKIRGLVEKITLLEPPKDMDASAWLYYAYSISAPEAKVDGPAAKAYGQYALKTFEEGKALIQSEGQKNGLDVKDLINAYNALLGPLKRGVPRNVAARSSKTQIEKANNDLGPYHTAVNVILQIQQILNQRLQ